MRNAVKVLIVDDDKAVCQVMSEAVKRLGLKPVVTNKALDALNMVRLQTVHAAILDVLLPKMTGVDLATEFRKTKFADNPIIFVSGVFKDKSFAAEAIKKTGAVDFLFKPFELQQLTEALQSALGGLISAERYDVQALLTKKFKTPRERAKAIERLEPIKGLDFPFVLSYLLESKTSGHLNIVSDLGEIFGVKLVNGAVADVDSAESQATGVLALINQGYLAQEDWDEFQANSRRSFPIEKLVTEGYVSPHAVSVAKHEQILSDFKSICAANSIQINFVPTDTNDDMPKHAVRMGEILSMFIFGIEDFFSQDYLESFFKPVMDHPIHLSQSPQEIDEIWSIEMFKPVVAAKEIAIRHGTMNEMIKALPKQRARIFQTMHFLVLNNWLTFYSLGKEHVQTSMLERYKNLYEELRTLTPDRVFEYFGATPNSPTTQITSIYEEYVKANDPKSYQKSAPDVFEYSQKCFEIVKAAYEIMSDDDKRQSLKDQYKVQAGEKAKLAKKLTAEALEFLRTGKPQQALSKMKEAEAAHPSPMQYTIWAWAEVKAGQRDKKVLMDILRKLDGFSAEDRKTAFYFMALGLVKKAVGEGATAQALFEKALQIDPGFGEARRELNSTGAAVKKEKVDIFRDDLSTVVSQLFRRKAE